MTSKTQNLGEGSKNCRSFRMCLNLNDYQFKTSRCNIILNPMVTTNQKPTNKQMAPNQTYKFLHSEGNHKQNEKTTYGTGENICKQHEQQGLIFKNYTNNLYSSITKKPKQPNK